MTEHTLDLDEIAVRLNGHSIFSPSSSAMWTTCSGSLMANLNVQDSAGEDAATGTVAHGIGENWLLSGERPDHLIGTTETIKEGDKEFVIPITYEMLDAVERYVDWCINIPGTHFVETKVDFSDLTPIDNQRGTADHSVCQRQALTITDLKFGKGERVTAENNTQAIIYAYGFFREWDWLYDFQTITIRICQPRLDHFDVWVISREELLAKAEWIKERAHAAWCKDGSRHPSEKGCRWCKVKDDCVAFTAMAHRLTEGVFDDLTITTEDMDNTVRMIDDNNLNLRPVDLHSLTTTQKARILPYRSMIEKWFTAIAEDLEKRALDGEKVEGYKLVEGRSDRQFSSEDKAKFYLMELGVPEKSLYKVSFVGLGAVEEELRKKGVKRKDIPDMLKPIVIKPKGKPTLVVSADKRPAIESDGDIFVPEDDDL